MVYRQDNPTENPGWEVPKGCQLEGKSRPLMATCTGCRCGITSSHMSCTVPTQFSMSLDGITM